MTIEKKRDFLVNCAYWGVIVLAVYLGLKFLLPISIPFIFGIGIGFFVLRLSALLRCPRRIPRILLTALVYGILALLVTLLIVKGVDATGIFIRWLPRVYDNKVLPLVTMGYEWISKTIRSLDPTLISALEMLLESVLSALKNLVTYLSGAAVDLISSIATGIPNLILSLLAMIFSTVFLVADYERIRDFALEHTPAPVKTVLEKVAIYLTETLFVVIRSYALIMLLTFTELSLLFTLFRIEAPVLKAAIIAVLDIMPILGTGGIMIPWAVISFILGYTKLGVQLLVIYLVVTIIRNYVEPKIVGTQLGLHPIITLIAMFIGLRLFGFWALFGLPVGISFLWKERNGQNIRQ